MAQAEQRRRPDTNQIYPRSVFSGMADGIGDLPGRSARSDHASSLEVATPSRRGRFVAAPTTSPAVRGTTWMTLDELS